MSPWALQGAGITPGEHHCLILHLLSLTRLSIGDPASSPSRELISTQLLLPSSTQVLVAATHDCQDACVCVRGALWPTETPLLFLTYLLRPSIPRDSRFPPNSSPAPDNRGGWPTIPCFSLFFLGTPCSGRPRSVSGPLPSAQARG